MAPDPGVIRQLVNAPDHRQRVVLVVDHRIGRGLDVLHRQGVHPRHHLRQRHDASHRLELLRDPLPVREAGAVLGQDPRAEQEPGPGELLVADAVGQPDQVGLEVPQEIVKLVVLGGGQMPKRRLSE